MTPTAPPPTPKASASVGTVVGVIAGLVIVISCAVSLAVVLSRNAAGRDRYDDAGRATLDGLAACIHGTWLIQRWTLTRTIDGSSVWEHGYEYTDTTLAFDDTRAVLTYGPNAEAEPAGFDGQDPLPPRDRPRGAVVYSYSVDGDELLLNAVSSDTSLASGVNEVVPGTSSLATVTCDTHALVETASETDEYGQTYIRVRKSTR